MREGEKREGGGQRKTQTETECEIAGWDWQHGTWKQLILQMLIIHDGVGTLS